MKLRLSRTIGRWLNDYLKSYGLPWIYRPPVIIWPRRTIVGFISCILAQIDREEMEKNWGTNVYKNETA